MEVTAELFVNNVNKGEEIEAIIIVDVWETDAEHKRVGICCQVLSLLFYSCRSILKQHIFGVWR